MKLKAVQKAPVKEEETKEQRSRRGRNSRNKGASFERTIAGKFKKSYGEELVRTPQSGGFVKNDAKAGDFRGDVVPADDGVSLKLHIEAKCHKSLNVPSWIRQAENDCPEGKLPTVIYHVAGTSKDIVVMQLIDFLGITSTYKALESIQPPSKEEWSTIETFPDYQVSNIGRVKSFKNGKEKLLTPCVGSGGYYVVVLRCGNKSTTIRVHKLVSQYFVGKPDGRLVNHIDGDKSHNWSTNLEYTSYSENIQHAYDHGLRSKGEDISFSKLSDYDCVTIRLLLQTGMKRKELAEKYSVSETTIFRLNNDIEYRNPLGLSILYKNAQTWSLPKWFKQAESDCPKGKIPTVVFHQYGTSKDYIALSLEDFFSIVPKDMIISKKVKK